MVKIRSIDSIFYFIIEILTLKKDYQCNFFLFFLLLTIHCPILDHGPGSRPGPGPGPSPGPGPNIVPVLGPGPGPVIFLVTALVPVPVIGKFISVDVKICVFHITNLVE